MELDLLEVYFQQLNLTLGTSVLILDVLVREVRKILHKFSFGNLISFLSLYFFAVFTETPYCLLRMKYDQNGKTRRDKKKRSCNFAATFDRFQLPKITPAEWIHEQWGSSCSAAGIKQVSVS